MGRTVGRIIEVNGLRVKAQLFHLYPPYMVENGKYEPFPRINTFVKTNIGIDTIICQIVGEQSNQYQGEVKTHYLELQVKGYLSGDKFVQGLRMLPIVSANIDILDKEDYKRIYSSGSEHNIMIGFDLFDDQKEIIVDVNKIIPSHIGIFGNTGSGKSNTLTKILNEYTDLIRKYDTKNGKYLVFDINNEYGNNAICNHDNKIIYHLRTREKSTKRIPIQFGALTEDDFVVLMNASQRTQVPVIKNAFRKILKKEGAGYDASYYVNYLKSIIKNGKGKIFSSMRHYLVEYIDNISNFYYNATRGEFYYQDDEEGIVYLNYDKFTELLDNITVRIPPEPLDRFLFELYFAISHEHENGVNLEHMMPLIARAQRLISDLKKTFDFTERFKDIFEGKNVCIIQIGDVNDDMKEIIPSIVANNIFNRLVAKKADGVIKQIINIVVDEAHNILYDGASDNIAHNNVIEVFEKIIKEGRKFGLFLLLASQRPSDIADTLISQLHNYFIHKLVNPSDINKIRKAVAYMDENSMNFITVLAAGECIVSGTAFQLPAFVYINQVDIELRPNSENVKLIGENGLFEQ